jgi:DsbC/DsbD-like thiol-disulfide interchange protein
VRAAPGQSHLTSASTRRSRCRDGACPVSTKSWRKAAIFDASALRAALVAAALAASSALGSPGVVSLVSERTAYAPGTSVWVGLHFRLEPGWHTYWKNPGDNGMAPQVEWALPEGFRAGPLLWPAPQSFGEAPSISYGFADEVLLLAELSTPTSAPPGGVSLLRARVRWLACRESCVPGSGDVELALPASTSPAADAAWTGVFAAARAAQPPAPAGPTTASFDGHRFILRLPVPPDAPAPARAEFFCEDPETIDHSAAATWISDARGSRLSIPVSPYARGPAPRLRGIVRLGYATPVTWRVDVPVHH